MKLTASPLSLLVPALLAAVIEGRLLPPKGINRKALESNAPVAVPTNTTSFLTPTSSFVFANESPTFACNSDGYLVQKLDTGAGLFQLNLSTGAYVDVAEDIGGYTAINAIGYNVLDNYLYGFAKSSSSTGAVVRIDLDGQSSVVRILPISGINVGDVDENGHYWFSSGGNDWYKFDLLPGSSTYGEILASGTTTAPSKYKVLDWVYLPSRGDYLYTAAMIAPDYNKVGVARFDRTYQVWESLETYDITNVDRFGALYGSANGTFWASANGNGDIYRFDPDEAPVWSSEGPASEGNDGARCVSAPDLPQSTSSATPSSTTAPLSSSVALLSSSTVLSLSTVTRTQTSGTVGFTTTLPANGTTPATVVVDIPTTPAPIPITTTETSGTVGFVTTVPANGTTPATVIVDIPNPITTTITSGTAGFVTTIPGNGTTPATVVIDVPNPVTITVTSGTAGFTTTVPGNGVSPATIIVDVPNPVTTTITSGSAGFTTTVSGNGTSPATVIVDIPVPVTTTVTSGSVGFTTTVPGNGTSPATVIVDIPVPITTTVTSGTAGFTTTVPGNGTSPATIIVDVPNPVTTTVTSGSIGFTTTVPGNGTSPATVIVDIPVPVTTTVTSGSVGFTTTVPGNGSSPATVIIDIPVPITTTVTSGTVGFITTISGNGTTPATIVVDVPNPVTTTQTSGTAGFITTISGDGTTPATVVVDVPNPVTTIETSGTVGFTTTILASGTTPATVIVDIPTTPLPVPVTITEAYSTGSVTITFTETPASSGGTPTIVIETPVPSPSGSCPRLVGATCSPQGLNLAYYNNVFGDGGYGDSGGLGPTYYIDEGLAALAQSITNETYWTRNSKPSGSWEAINGFSYYPGYERTIGGITVDANNFTLVYQGYFKAPVSASYQFCRAADDAADFYWGNGNAFSCDSPETPSENGTAYTMQWIGSYIDSDELTCTVPNIDLTAGEYYPIRLVYGNFDYTSQLYFQAQYGGMTTETLDGTLYPYTC